MTFTPGRLASILCSKSGRRPLTRRIESSKSMNFAKPPETLRVEILLQSRRISGLFLLPIHLPNTLPAINAGSGFRQRSELLPLGYRTRQICLWRATALRRRSRSAGPSQARRQRPRGLIKNRRVRSGAGSSRPNRARIKNFREPEKGEATMGLTGFLFVRAFLVAMAVTQVVDR